MSAVKIDQQVYLFNEKFQEQFKALFKDDIYLTVLEDSDENDVFYMVELSHSKDRLTKANISSSLGSIILGEVENATVIETDLQFHNMKYDFFYPSIINNQFFTQENDMKQFLSQAALKELEMYEKKLNEILESQKFKTVYKELFDIWDSQEKSILFYDDTDIKKQIFLSSLIQDIDLYEYAKKEIDSKQLQEIKLGIQQNLNISIYASPEFFSWAAMREIRLGLEQDLDVETYANPALDSDQMHEVRLGLEQNLDVMKYCVNESSLIDNFSSEQMREIRLGIEKNLYVEAYNNIFYDDHQMRIIREALEDGIDISAFANPAFSAWQMYLIREGIRENLDVSLYAKEEFSPEQMEEIKKGLENNVNVKVYADPKYDAREMKKIRKELEKSKTIKH
ncbi:hypothetical protein SHELI_v1c09010 [Spiroplasma helicoides]|uniref:Uncharacterized protein n=1 Tax=Spiroplasma helicoides TaxID=216938 RepID=A0A1B3SLS1_9MOLU|nr:hypothetical protein [Spiroplasma helicoides]AOG60850.1 hypothetical protein SHELI_v1c09010 [Spiroplasma helicoides]